MADDHDDKTTNVAPDNGVPGLPLSESDPERVPAPPYAPGEATDEVHVPPGEVPEPTPAASYDPSYAPAPRIRTPSVAVNIVLFVLTLISSIYWGFLQYQIFYEEELRGLFTYSPFESPEALLGGLPFALAAIAFLLAHEMGHYLACRCYGISATLPYFLPMPAFIAPLLPGTMGAVIRITSPITTRRALFDIAVAGPIAGWITALPILAFGLSQSRVVSTVEIETSGKLYLTLGEPLIWEPMARLFGPATGPGEELITHPLAYVGWFALLVTAMNLLPVGQLDGGHLMYSFSPSRHRLVSLSVLAFMIYAGVRHFAGWLVFAVLILLVLGTRHPQPQNFDQSLGGGRIFLALLAVVIFVTSFMLVPVTIPRFFL